MIAYWVKNRYHRGWRPTFLYQVKAKAPMVFSYDAPSHPHGVGSYVMLIQPSAFEFNRILTAILASSPDEYDMEIINKLYRGNALVIPHRPYGLLSGEFRSKEHSKYLGNSEEEWDPVKALREARLVHFSDWPVPKVARSSDHSTCCQDTQYSSSLGFTIRKSR